MFTWEILDNATVAYNKLLSKIAALKDEGEVDRAAFDEYKAKFMAAMDNDLNTSMAVTELYDVLKAKTNDATKLAILNRYDQVLSLSLLENAAAVREANAKAQTAKAEGGYTVTGEPYEALGKAMGVDAAAFAETMDKWNGYDEAMNDPAFGSTSFANPLNTAPYYAIKVTAGVHHTMGGLQINPNTEVLNENGEVIPGLFAAGEVTGGVHGANRLGGNAVADFTVFGRIAGAAASKYAA